MPCAATTAAAFAIAPIRAAEFAGTGGAAIGLMTIGAPWFILASTALWSMGSGTRSPPWPLRWACAASRGASMKAMDLFGP